MGGKALDVRLSRNKRLLAVEDLFNASGEGFPIISGDIQGAEVEDDSLSGAFSGSHGLHESMVDIIAGVVFDDLLNEHRQTIAYLVTVPTCCFNAVVVSFWWISESILNLT